jgi:hypothetical protein
MLTTTEKEARASGLAHSVHDITDEVQSAANRAGRKVRGIYNAGRDEVQHLNDQVKSEIYDHPVRSSMIALGVGVVLGALLRR